MSVGWCQQTFPIRFSFKQTVHKRWHWVFGSSCWVRDVCLWRSGDRLDRRRLGGALSYQLKVASLVQQLLYKLYRCKTWAQVRADWLLKFHSSEWSSDFSLLLHLTTQQPYYWSDNRIRDAPKHGPQVQWSRTDGCVETPVSQRSHAPNLEPQQVNSPNK